MARRSRPPRESRSVETTGRTIDEAVANASAKLKVSEHDLDIQVIEEGRGGFLGIGSKEAKVRATLKRGGGGGSERSPRGPREEREARPPREDGGGRRGRRTDAPQARRDERTEEGGGDREGRRGRGGRGRGRGRGRDDDGPRMDSRERRPRPGGSHERSDRSGGRPRRDMAVNNVPAEPDADFEARAKELLSGILDRMGFAPAVESRFDDGAYHLTIQGGDDESVLIGRKGETLDALQHIVYKSISRGREDSLTVRIDVAGYREKREEALADHAKALAAEVLASGRSQQTEPLPPVERRTVHRAVAEIEGVSSRAIGNGHVKKILIEVEGQEQSAGDFPAESAPRPRRAEAMASVSDGEVLDYVSQPLVESAKQTDGSDTSSSDWGRRARPSKKVRRR
ncbi:MAG: RNA-binding cell elongation regulator Jag/EloR [Candidatus Eisenbacteria bacterium]